MITVPYDHSGKPRPERVWLDKNTHHALIDIERKYSDIAWTPIAAEIIPDDNFVDVFNQHAIPALRKEISYDDLHPAETHPDGKSSSWYSPIWKSLDIYRGPRSKDWFGIDTFDTRIIDGAVDAPLLYQQVFDLMPFKEIFFIRCWDSQRVVMPHRDQDWVYNVPMSFRVMLHDNNDLDTFYLSKTRGTGAEKHYVHLPNDTNTFAFNNGAFWHGSDYCGKSKILMLVTGIPDPVKLEALLDKSVSKYSPARIYNKEDRYVVYNITSKEYPIPDPHDQDTITELYTLLLTAPEVVNVETHATPCGTRSELRVIFWNQDSYYNFSSRVSEKYQVVVEKLNKGYLNKPVEFARYTSAEGYESEFPYKKYPDANKLINWTLIDYFKHWVIENLIPMGKVKDYFGQGKFVDSYVTASRFLKERTSNIVRLLPSKKSLEGFPTWIAYNFEHALQYAITQQPFVYHRFTKLCHDVENMVAEYIKECEHAAVLMSHKALGDKINLHTHRLSDERSFSLTVMVRLTFDDDPCVIEFYPPKDDHDKNLNLYYQRPDILIESTQAQTPVRISTQSRASMFIFNAGYTPHSVNYNNDIYLFFVYDNVTFHDGAYEKIKQQAQYSEFNNYPEHKQMHFVDITN